jgi:hypothetical protein
VYHTNSKVQAAAMKRKLDETFIEKKGDPYQFLLFALDQVRDPVLFVREHHVHYANAPFLRFASKTLPAMDSSVSEAVDFLDAVQMQEFFSCMKDAFAFEVRRCTTSLFLLFDTEDVPEDLLPAQTKGQGITHCAGLRYCLLLPLPTHRNVHHLCKRRPVR